MSSVLPLMIIFIIYSIAHSMVKINKRMLEFFHLFECLLIMDTQSFLSFESYSKWHFYRKVPKTCYASAERKTNL